MNLIGIICFSILGIGFALWLFFLIMLIPAAIYEQILEMKKMKKNNSYHPEYWGTQKTDLINNDDRDKALKNKIEYYSETVLPQEIADKITETEERIKSHRGELDKINCDMRNLKYYLVRWFDSHLT